MNAHAYPLTAKGLALAALLVLLAGGLSLLLKLDLERRLFYATGRMVVQLTLMGYVLHWVFALDAGGWVALILIVMLLVAAWNAIKRPSRTFRGAYPATLLTMLGSGLAVSLYTTSGVIGTATWYEPRYIIPLTGMALGNSLTGISLGLDHLLETFARRRDEVEADLAFGATTWEAARGPVAEAVRRGMIPTINAMMVMGLVFLPGMMTGQVLGGEPPLEAVKYQAVVMCMISGSVALGTTILCLLAVRLLFNDRHQLRAERIHDQSN